MSYHDLQNISLDTLPHLVLRNLLSYFTYKDIFKLRCVSRTFRYHCEDYLKRATEKLRRKFLSQGKKINEKLNSLSENSTEFQDNLTKYYNVQLILNEIDIILFKQKLIFEYYIPGHLLDNLNCVLKQINESGNSTQLLDVYKKFVHISKVYFYKPYVIQIDFLGIHIVNLLNLLKDVKYIIIVTYDTLFRTCHVQAEYNVQNFKIFKTLLYLSEHNINKNDHVLTDIEKRLIIKQLILMADLHNSFVVRNNIYERNIHHRNEYFSDNYKEFERSRRKRIVFETGHRIQEVYANFTNETFSQDGLWCRMNFKCPLYHAPYFIVKEWKNINYSEIMDNPSKISKLLENIDNTYSFQIQFKLDTTTRSKHSCILEGTFHEKSRNIANTLNDIDIKYQNVIIL